MIGALLRMPAAFWRSPLVRNGYALIISAGLTSVLGLAYWIIAAHTFSAGQLGMGAALISTMLTLGNVSQLNFGNLLNRYLPVAGSKRQGLILSAYGSAALAALVASFMAVQLTAHYFHDLEDVFEDRLNAWAFIAGTIVWTIFALQDAVLAGLRKGTIVPLENAIYSTAKLLLLFVFAGLAVTGSGVYAAWIVPLPIIVVAVNAYIFLVLLAPTATAPSEETAIDFRELRRFFGWDYVGTLATMAAMGIVPLLILGELGSAHLAAYHLAWTITYTLYLIGRSMGVSLLAESAANRTSMSVLVADALVYTVIPLIIAIVLVCVFAPLVMELFGEQYVSLGVGTLRLLALSCLPWAITTIYLAYARSTGRTFQVAVIQIATLILVIGLADVLIDRFGLSGIGIAWFVANLGVACGLLVYLVRSLGWEGVLGFSLQLSSAAARMLSPLSQLSFQAKGNSAGIGHYPHSDFVAASGFDPERTLRPLQSVFSQSDVVTWFLGEPGDTLPRLLLKAAVSPHGDAALRRYARCLADITSDTRLAASARYLPEILAMKGESKDVCIVENLVPGQDARKVLSKNPDAAPEILAAAVVAITEIHDATSAAQIINPEWVMKWIERPISLMASPMKTIQPLESRAQALVELKAFLRKFWLGREVSLGRGHGDFSLGNLMFRDMHKDDTEKFGLHGQYVLSGLIDWDRSETDAPRGLDSCHLALTASATARGEELGQCVKRMLLRPKWDKNILSWLQDNQPVDAGIDWLHDHRAVQAMVCLAWMQHLNADLEKSGRYTNNRVWVASNLDWVTLALKPSVLC